MKKTHFNLKVKRRRKGVTDYKKRLKILLSGKPRLVVRKTLNNILAQIIEYAPQGDKVVISAHSSELKKFGWSAGTGNLPSAYLTGLLLGKKAKKKGVKEAVLDIGLNIPTKGGKLYAALKGAVDGGINIPHSEEILPSQERIKGAHISSFSKLLKDGKVKSDKQFAAYAKGSADPLKMNDYFDNVKKKISEA